MFSFFGRHMVSVLTCCSYLQAGGWSGAHSCPNPFYSPISRPLSDSVTGHAGPKGLEL